MMTGLAMLTDLNGLFKNVFCRIYPLVTAYAWQQKERHSFIGGSLELPMWLTDGFLVTFFGRWWGAVRIHVSHIQLPYTVHCTW